MPAGGSIPCWKQRTKGQWLAWIARRLRWVLDAFYVTLFLTLSPDRRRFDVSVTGVAAVTLLSKWQWQLSIRRQRNVLAGKHAY